MYLVGVHKNIQLIIKFLYRAGFWNRHDDETVGEKSLKIFYSIYFLFLPISLAAGAVTNTEKDEKIFLVLILLFSIVIGVRILFFIWEKKPILEFLDHICNYAIDDRATYCVVNNKMKNLMNFAVFFVSIAASMPFTGTFVAPLVGTERQLFLQIGFPLDWRNSEFGFWMAFTFLVAEGVICTVSLSFSIMIWYLMANCSWRYEVLGSEIKRMGELVVVEELTNQRAISKNDKDVLYNRDLVAAMISCQSLKEKTDQLILFMSKLFVVQLTTGALCICLSIYTLTIIRGENLVELIIYVGGLIYSIFDIFMIMHLGNEVQLASGRLFYNLYESNWIDRSQSVKKNFLIFGELLMQPHQLMILKIYPLTLETFQRIVNSAYSMLNILKNFK